MWSLKKKTRLFYSPGLMSVFKTGVLCCVCAASIALFAQHSLSAAESSNQQGNSNNTAKQKKQQREEILRKMRQRAEGITVTILSGDKQMKTKLVAKPIFRFSDQPRYIRDATLWVWTQNGRPVSVCKIEGYRSLPENENKLRWLYNFSSFSTELIEAEWSFGHRWTARKAPLKLLPLPNGEKPSNSKTGRLLQFKKIARRFSSTMYITPSKQQVEMRLLSQPIFRYSHPDSGLLDGAIFGFASYGTNPDALFTIELHQKKDASPEWKFGVIGMTQGGLSVRLDGKQVWTKPWTKSRGSLETWTWFNEPRIN